MLVRRTILTIIHYRVKNLESKLNNGSSTCYTTFYHPNKKNILANAQIDTMDRKAAQRRKFMSL